MGGPHNNYRRYRRMRERKDGAHRIIGSAYMYVAQWRRGVPAAIRTPPVSVTAIEFRLKGNHFRMKGDFAPKAEIERISPLMELR